MIRSERPLRVSNCCTLKCETGVSMYGERLIGDGGMSLNIVFKRSCKRRSAALALPRLQGSVLVRPIREQAGRALLRG
jgi:hypothetical protein